MDATNIEIRHGRYIGPLNRGMPNWVWSAIEADLKDGETNGYVYHFPLGDIYYWRIVES